ncbi:hypothetical protein EDS67_28335 [candidate division KSB1 bacterium]|nr:MAG: hypothetical protein EDS67_28335 [candidate division KSB1 bacterium]MCE7942185.1 hypothetical protein [Chlorobi bacterium CHB1]MDL1875662.1 hypothetical protein [Cytophagia bacterium CHB2]
MERSLRDEMAEARAVQAGGNIGRARTCARRAAGMALRDALGIGPGLQTYASTFIEGLRKLSQDDNYPSKVRDAAARLTDRSKPDRTSASANPVRDAEIIIQHFGLDLFC